MSVQRSSEHFLALVASLRDFGIALGEISVVVECDVFFITFEQKLIPLGTVHAWHVDCPVVALGQTLWRQVRVQRVSVSSMEDDSVAQFLPQEGLEQGEDHVEDFRLIDDVNSLDSQRHRVLQPVNDSLGKRRRKLPGLLERQTVHVEDHNRSIDLRFWLEHSGFEEKHAALEDLVEADFLVLPFLCGREN
jgi:hypothetical protein